MPVMLVSLLTVGLLGLGGFFADQTALAAQTGPSQAGQAAPARSDRPEGPPEWLLDPPHCAVTFEVRHVFVKVPGRFQSFSGFIRLDPDRPETGAIDALVATDSVYTGVDKRDEHLRSPEFLDTTRYPWMRFRSVKIARQGGQAGNVLAVTGELTIKDVTKTVTIPLTLVGVKDDPLRPGLEVMGLEGGLAVDQLEYHVGDGKYVKMGVVGQDAAIGLHLELIRPKP